MKAKKYEYEETQQIVKRKGMVTHTRTIKIATNDQRTVYNQLRKGEFSEKSVQKQK